MIMEYDVTPQRQAYLDARGYTILTACPGSGKTTSIVNKLLTVSRYCKEYYGKHTGFACLSFTNKACAELKQKYREMHDERLAFPNEVLTIIIMKKNEFDGLVKINNEGMKAVKGGYTLHTVTVTPNSSEDKGDMLPEDDCPDHGNGCDGDDGIHND